MNDVIALILAAGKGVRMRSDLAKVLHPICGQPMLSYVLGAIQELGLPRVMVIVGHQSERIKEEFAATSVGWVVQSEQLGTAHAVQCALPRLDGFSLAQLPGRLSALPTGLSREPRGMVLGRRGSRVLAGGNGHVFGGNAI